jgi:serine/threonine protein kinase
MTDIIRIGGEDYVHVGAGKEGDVYVSTDKKYVLKVYKPPLKLEKIFQEINFLKTYETSGVVPIIYKNTESTILMEYLVGYINLKKFITMKKAYTLEQQNQLLMNIVNARKKLGEDIFYRDMHLENILFNPITLDIKFIDQGMSEYQELGWLINMKKIVEDLKMSRVLTGNLILKGRV